jgi:cytoskeletal protein CcmA (bactofilin family)
MLQKDRFWTRNDAPARAEIKPENKPAATPSPAPRRAADALLPPEPRKPVADAKPEVAAGTTSPATAEGSKLIVGPRIKLKGVEITDCDTLIVEGHVEATMDSRAIQISPEGSFTGNAGIDIAEIRGQFSGEITVRQCLTIHATGKVSGKVRYQKLVIEEGGELAGDIKTIGADDRPVRTTGAALPASPATPARHPTPAHPFSQ